MRFYNRNELLLLTDRIEGDVHTDLLERYLLCTDASMYKKMPACVVYPKTQRDVVEVVRFGNENDFTVHPRGAGSGLCGASLGNGIVIDFTRYMNRLIHLDLEKGVVVCEPGYRMGELSNLLKDHPFFFPPDPSSGEYATLGGMVSTNASGSHSVKYGNTGDYLLDADVVLGAGSTITLSKVAKTKQEDLSDDLKSLMDLYIKNREQIESAYPAVRFNNSGYNLKGLVKENRLYMKDLFAGAEGTLGIATRLKFKLKRKPAHSTLIVAFFDEINASARTVQKLLGFNPSGIEIMDRSLLMLAKDHDPALEEVMPSGVDNVILIEFDAHLKMECESSEKKATALLSSQKGVIQYHVADSPEEKARLWAIRKAAVPILYRLKGQKKAIALVEDAAVPTDKLVDYFERTYALFKAFDIDFIIYGHIAKGLMHTRPLLDLKNKRDVDTMKKLSDAMFDIVFSLKGSISGEHGDGRLRSSYIKKQYPDIYEHFLYVKYCLDPEKVLNPEIKISHDPHLISRNLRYGFSYDNTKVKAKNLLWPEGFSDQIETCHGCSKCTTITTDTRMCPIYKFTRKEAASPKAKANILRALISGAIRKKDLFAHAFQEVMSCCVGCGSCAVECPSHVNIPKMAIEAKALAAKRKGLDIENRLTAHAETLLKVTRKIAPMAQRFVKIPYFQKSAGLISGITVNTALIPSSHLSFFDQTPEISGEGDKRVLYFTGCYAGYLRPEIGKSAVSVLTRLGMTVLSPPQFCCGLPMFSKGLTGSARDKVQRNLKTFGRLIETVDHVVVTCSSCGYALLKGWPDLFSSSLIHTIGSKLIHITALIQNELGDAGLKGRGERYAYHMPCHLKVQRNSNCSIALLDSVEDTELEVLNSHCCGMAGSWGLLRKNASLSRTIGSDLIELLKQTDVSAGVTDCPTCRIQMELLSDVPVYHPIQVIESAMV